MPCNSDYLRQTPAEAAFQQIAKFCVFVGTRLDVTVPVEIRHQTTQYYAEDVGQTEWLCARIRQMTDAEREAIIYDSHVPISRALATWWEEHLAADAEREFKSVRDLNNAALIASAKAKLTKDEIDALNL